MEFSLKPIVPMTDKEVGIQKMETSRMADKKTFNESFD